MSEQAAVPAAIGELIVSPRAYAAQTQLLQGFAWLRTACPIGRVEVDGFDPFWAIARHADIAEVNRRSDVFHNGDRATTLVPRAADAAARAARGGAPHMLRSLLQMDAAEHAAYRGIVQDWFRQSGMPGLEALVRRHARAAVGRMAAHGEACDFFRDVAVHYPLDVILDLFGAPLAEAPRLLDLTLNLFRSQDEGPAPGTRASREPARHAQRVLEAYDGYAAFFTPMLEARRQRPRDDLLSRIANASIAGTPIAGHEATSYCMMLATAGHHTTAASLAGAVWALCEHPAELRKVLDDRALLPRLADEAVRWTTPVQHVMRTAAEDVVLDGRSIARGDWLMLCYLSGNRDEAVFADPARFHVGADARPGLGYGSGPHACLGLHLARLELRIFFEELLARLTRLGLAGSPRRSASLFLGGPRALPISYALN